MLKIAFVGIGSIGTRHLNNVHEYLTFRKKEFVLDVYRSGIGKELSPELQEKINHQYHWQEGMPVSGIYDAVFVTNPTSLHYSTLMQWQHHGRAFFIEKPVFASTDENLKQLATLNQNKCYVACPLRYNSVIQYIKDNINLADVIGVRAISSSYLPEWRPGTDYRQCYSAHTDMGGGVDIDLIHEWDYITYLFGFMTEGSAIRGKISDLEIDSNDIAIYMARNKQLTVELHLDYYGRYNIRKIELFCKDDTIECDILAGIVTYQKSGKKISFVAERNISQMREIELFFEIVFDRVPSDSTIEHALKVLRYAKGDFK